ncbi:MAG: uracil-DNA glycosylase family protein [Rikenellaceae bacterium]|nr:uracil-DNA glycosylase family protein [Rikenellaceae bacterium]
MTQPIETHPFTPFLPHEAKVLFLGSFPPQPHRWNMKFYYPNITNDFWYIMGHIWYSDRNHLLVNGRKQFDYERIVDFCQSHGIALYDAATKVRRAKDNASDKYLEIVECAPIGQLLKELPACRAIVTTGQKATETVAEILGCDTPAIGSFCEVRVSIFDNDKQAEFRTLKFYRMPSTSRAYPLPLIEKAAQYRLLFESLGMIGG